MPRTGRRTLHLLAATLVVTLLAWVPVLPADAHGALVSSDPPDAGLSEAMPSRAFLTFSDTVREVREVAVIGPDGSVTNGEATSVGPEVRQTLWAGPDGDYTMSYFVVSADGHDIRGEVHFEVGDLSVAAAEPTADPAPARAAGDTDEAGASAVVPVAVVVLSAAVALVLVLWRRRVGSPEARS